MRWYLCPGLVALFLIIQVTSALGGVVEDAPEAAEYTLVYELEIPDIAGFNQTDVPYTTDLSDTIDFTFDRVAYHLELQQEGGERVFVYVSLPALVFTATETGVPHVGTGVFLQQLIEDVHVVSNHPDLAQYSEIDTGSIEFWPSNYMTNNSLSVPGATNDLYDTGDQAAGGAGYGSMQIHDYASNQTLFAYNSWGPGTQPSDLGIGNNPTPPAPYVNPDWTFSQNAASYTLKTLRVLVRQGAPTQGLSLEIQSPDPHQVVQRQPGNTGTLPVAGKLKTNCDLIEGRVVPIDLEGANVGTVGPWAIIEDAPSGSSFYGSLEATAGWYRLELRVWSNDIEIDTVMVEPVGVGEVFITAGQSNSANHGESPTSPSDPRVSAWGQAGWQFAADPQPIATGSGGSPWPALGDLLAERFDVPIGLISVGVGGTAVDQWRPFSENALYPRLLLALGEVGESGARAILWHQGESDAVVGTTAADYASQLEEVIAATRADAGWEIPWGVARAAFLPSLSTQSTQPILDGQQMVIDADPLTFEGPFTDDLIGDEWRWDTVHFNLAGLAEHAKRWDETIVLPACEGFVAEEECEEDRPEMDAGSTDDGGTLDDPVLSDDTSPSEDAEPDTKNPDDALMEDSSSQDDAQPRTPDAGTRTPDTKESGQEDTTPETVDTPNADDGCQTNGGNPSSGVPLSAMLLLAWMVAKTRVGGRTGRGR